ncbi:MAG: hypothetical protein QM535_19580, partial [Limnohabitans sp.]|nr:hypothetical protein [Limnohabitans sp.]
MDNINGIPLIWDTEGDKKLFGGLFAQGFNSRYPTQNSVDREIRRKNPLANSPLSKNGNDVRDNFFGGSKIENYNNFQVIIDPTSNINPKDKIEPITHSFYRDSNHNGIQDNGEYDIKVKLFISKIKEQLDEVYNNPTIKPEPREILLFLEDNANDFSGTTFYIKKGNLVDTELSNVLSKSNLFSDYINSKYKISSSELKELLIDGKINHPIWNVISTFVELAGLLTTNPIILKTIAGAIKKGVDFIKDNCLIDEKNWNPKKVEKGNKFEPFLFSEVSESLDKMDDKAINELLKKGVKNLNTEMKKYDAKVKEALDIINKVPIPILLPLIPVSVPTKMPKTFTDALWDKYIELRKTMDKILVDVEKIDFSTMLNEGINAVNAFICGVWNGFIEAVCGIISLVQYLYEGAEFFTDLLRNFKTKGPELLEKIDDIILKFQAIDFGKIFTKLVADIKQWVFSDSSFSLTEIAYFSGMFIGIIVELVIEIVVGILFTGGTLTVEAILVKLGETFKALGNLLIGVLKLPVKVVGKTVSVLYNALHWVYEFLAKGTDEILRIIDEVFDAYKIYLKDSLELTYSKLLPFIGAAEVKLTKKVLQIFFGKYGKLLLKYAKNALVISNWKRLDFMNALTREEIQELLEIRE